VKIFADYSKLLRRCENKPEYGYLTDQTFQFNYKKAFGGHHVRDGDGIEYDDNHDQKASRTKREF
jgi:hypothetical protein